MTTGSQNSLSVLFALTNPHWTVMSVIKFYCVRPGKLQGLPITAVSLTYLA